MLSSDIRTIPAPIGASSGSVTAGTGLSDVAGALARTFNRCLDDRQSIRSLAARHHNSVVQLADERPDRRSVAKAVLLVLAIIGSVITASIGPSA